jgi:hypothetical protein
MVQARRRGGFQEFPRRVGRVDHVGWRNRAIDEDRRRLARQQRLVDGGDAAFARVPSTRFREAFYPQDVGARRLERKPLASSLDVAYTLRGFGRSCSV